MAHRRAAASCLLLLRRALDAPHPSAPASMLSASSAAASSGGGAGQQPRRAASSSAAAPAPGSGAAPATRSSSSSRKPAGYVWHELMFWHNPGELGDLATRVQPTRHLEHSETKRRLHNLVELSGLLSPSPLATTAAAAAARGSVSGSGSGGSSSSGGEDGAPSPSPGRRGKRRAGPALVEIEPRMATVAELERAHDPAYVAEVIKKSADSTSSIHRIGDESAFAPGGFEVAALSAGAALSAAEAVLRGDVAAAYALSRPPGHHATRATGGGFCLFNNVAIAALHALEGGALAARAAGAAAAAGDRGGSTNTPPPPPLPSVERVAVVDFDVHHGNGTQDIFYRDDRVLFVSLHQDGNYPLHEGKVDEVGAGRGEGYNINVPLPPGSGSGAYRAAFDRVVVPALDAFRPDLVLVSAGYDASYMDPLGQMMLGSHDYRYFMRRLRAAAARHARGRIVAVHEGGYSDAYVPFCGLAAIEALCGTAAAARPRIADPYWSDVSAFAYQALQPWQDAVLREVERGPLRLLRARCAEPRRQQAGGGRARPTLPGATGGEAAGRKAAAPPPEATSVPASMRPTQRRAGGSSSSSSSSPSSSRTTAAREPEVACG